MKASVILYVYWKFYSSSIWCHVEKVGTKKKKKKFRKTTWMYNLYKKEKKEEKNLLLRALLSLSLDVDENDIWFSK